MSRLLAFVFAAIVGLSACGPDDSAIYDTAPFFDIEADFSSAYADAFLRASEQFARRRGYEIAINRFGDGMFSVLMHDGPPASLNLLALNPVAPGVVGISAISRQAPTGEDRAAANAYVAEVRPYISNVRPVANWTPL